MHNYREDAGRATLGTDKSGARFRQQDQALGQSKDELMAAFQNLVTEGKEFLKSTAGLSGDAVEDARTRFAARLADAKQRWGGWSHTARVRSRQAAIVTDDYVHSKPWLAIGLAAGIAFVIAAVTTRR